MIERIPPHNEEAERAVLGAVMLDRDRLADVLEEITASDFYNEANKEVFEAIHDLVFSGASVDMLTVCEQLKKRNTLEMVGGRAYIAMLTAEVPSTSNVLEYAKIVSEKASLRQLIKTSERITDMGYKAELDAKEIVNNAEASILSISQKNQRHDYSKIQDVLLENLRIIDEATKHQGEVTGVPSGFKALDDKTNGFQKSDLIIVAARPAMGKTAFALNIALNAATKANSSVMIFSLEMSEVQLSQRLLSMQSRVEAEKLKKGNISKVDWDKINIALDTLNPTKIHIDDTPGISIMEMKNKCRRLKASEGLDLVIVDYLQLIPTMGRSDNRTQAVGELSRQLKLLARELSCPIIVLSQLSRGPEQRPDHHPNLSDLRESGSIEQDADIVLMLYRDDYYHPESEKAGICEVSIAKNRSGSTGMVELTWVSMYTMFSNKA